MHIDANIVIAYLNGDIGVIRQMTAWKEQGRTFFLSTVAEAEILSFPDFSIAELRTTEKFLEENFISLPIDRSVARRAASFRRTSRMKLPDAVIAATAIGSRMPLVTRNVKDFRKITSLRIVEIH